MAMETSPIETHTSETRTAGMAESISTAKPDTVVLRASVTVQPRLSSIPQPPPPTRLPAPATMNGIHPNLPIDCMLKWLPVQRSCRAPKKQERKMHGRETLENEMPHPKW